MEKVGSSTLNYPAETISVNIKMAIIKVFKVSELSKLNLVNLPVMCVKV